jgi:predicted molibdopterin-dependent oxidoreductase YjgC
LDISAAGNIAEDVLLRTQLAEFDVEVDGEVAVARTGDTVAAVLLRGGISSFRHTATGHPRGVFCGMGVCFDCLVTIDGLPEQRACFTLATPGMRIATEKARAGR